MDLQKIAVHYKCACMKAEAEVLAPARAPDESVTFWVEQTVGWAVSTHHMRNSPHCPLRVMDYVKIPVPDAAPYVGAPPIVQ
jgi:hypothetical protein